MRAARLAVIRGPAFGIPPAPPASAGAEPIRIVDPSGGAIAWIAPGAYAGCAGFAVRRPDAPADGWLNAFPPGDAPGRWIMPVVLLDEPSAERAAELDSPERPLCWRFAERDPTKVVLDADGPLGVRLRFAASLDDARLTLAIEATNEGADFVAIGLSLRFRTPPDAQANGPAADGVSIPRGEVVARWRTPDGAVFTIAAVEGVDSVQFDAAPNAIGGPSLTALGFRPAHGLANLPPGGQARAAASIGTIER